MVSLFRKLSIGLCFKFKVGNGRVAGQRDLLSDGDSLDFKQEFDMIIFAFYTDPPAVRWSLEAGGKEGTLNTRKEALQRPRDNIACYPVRTEERHHFKRGSVNKTGRTSWLLDLEKAATRVKTLVSSVVNGVTLNKTGQGERKSRFMQQGWLVWFCP